MPIVTFPQVHCAIELPSGSSLLEVEDEPRGSGIISFGCRAGSCGACVVKVLEGMDALDPIEEPEADFLTDLGYSTASHRLACLCTVRGDLCLSAAS